MDGVEATRQIVKHSPCAILIVTANVDENAVNTPILGIQDSIEAGQPLLAKIATMSKLIGKSTQRLTAKTQPAKIAPNPPPHMLIPPLVGSVHLLVAPKL